MDIVFVLNIRFKKKDSFCASYCLHINYLPNVLGVDIKSAVLNLYYQKI